MQAEVIARTPRPIPLRPDASLLQPAERRSFVAGGRLWQQSCEAAGLERST
jgi:hypothetical protein